MSEENKAIVLKYWDAANSHDMDTIRATLTEGYIHHDPNLPVVDADRETHLQIIVGGMMVAFPDLTVSIAEMVAEGDMVSVRWSFTGTHTGEMPGDPPMPPTGKKVNVTAMAMHRIADGKVAETWVNFDIMGMLQQLGAIPG